MAAAAWPNTPLPLVEQVLPQVPVRQWVLTLPYRLRYRLAWDHALCRAILGVFAHALLAFYTRTARTDGIRDGQTGTLTVIQRFGSGLQLNIHFHALVLDGVFNLLFYHGVLAPRARWRSRVIGYGRPTPDRPAVALEPRPRGNIPTPAWTWAALMRRVFALDVLVCPRCAGPLRVIATVHDPAVVRAILAHLGLAPGPDRPGPAPPPPEHPAATA